MYRTGPGSIVFRMLWLALAIAMSPAMLPAVSAGWQDEKPKPKKEMVAVDVLVVDPDGHPVDGATVICTGLRSRNDPGAFGLWPESAGRIPELKTGPDGKVAYPCPKFFGAKDETGQIIQMVSHESFVIFQDDRNVEAEPAKVTLERGFRIAASAVDGESGERITTGLYGHGNCCNGMDWGLKNDGMIVSPTMPARGVVQFRLIRIIDGKATHFSELETDSPGDRSRVLMQNVAMKPGVRLEGKLDAAVTRPVVNGKVILDIATPLDRLGQSWSWSDEAVVQEDGSFVFESLPAGEVVQVLVLCDGWISVKPELADVTRFFPGDADRVFVNIQRSLPQPFLLDQERSEVVVAMEKTTSCRVTAVDGEGAPVAGARVIAFPNQYCFNGGSQILGNSYPAARGLEAIRDGIKPDQNGIGRKMLERFDVQTDSSGNALLQNLPVYYRQSVVVWREGFQMSAESMLRASRLVFSPGGVTELAIKMEKREGTITSAKSDGGGGGQ